jgi:hypothetical protein
MCLIWTKIQQGLRAGRADEDSPAASYCLPFVSFTVARQVFTYLPIYLVTSFESVTSL